MKQSARSSAKLRSKRAAPEQIEAWIADRDGTAVLVHGPRGPVAASWVDDLDTREILAACGASDGSCPVLARGLEASAEMLLDRYDRVVAVGSRGGRKVYVAAPQPAMMHRLLPPASVQAATIRGSFPSLAKWDVLVRGGTMTRPRFVALEAVMPSGRAVSRHPHLLLRAKAPDGSWRYLSYNVRAGAIDGGWDHGSAEGRTARSRAARDALAWRAATFERLAVDRVAPLSRRRRILALERKLTAAFGSALVVEAGHTRQPQRIVVGAAARRLSSLGAMYGESGPRAIVAIVDGGDRNFTDHVMQLAAEAGMLVAVEAAIRSGRRNRPLTSS